MWGCASCFHGAASAMGWENPSYLPQWGKEKSDSVANSSRLSSSVFHVAFSSPISVPLKVKCLIWPSITTSSIIKRRQELPQGYWLVTLLFGVNCPGTVSTGYAQSLWVLADWNLILKQWKSKERNGSFTFWHICVLLDNWIQKGRFKWAISGNFNRIPWCLASYRPEQLAFPVF